MKWNLRDRAGESNYQCHLPEVVDSLSIIVFVPGLGNLSRTARFSISPPSSQRGSRVNEGFLRFTISPRCLHDRGDEARAHRAEFGRQNVSTRVPSEDRKEALDHLGFLAP